ncbi:hypothetical protein PsYK624_048780 [Phanerochaete sordida]|uniref:Uncharacterized protein n=1 Tax=Phanerochaete sordida TaxID=48140 RepID=A0A9P3G5S5_9APHY|nr:hypothetical protein PsYK624_048780 [Phanerochaete sordida]
MPFFTRNSMFSASTTTLTSAVPTPNASTTSLVAHARPEKDYFAASGALMSAYGFGGCAPVLPPATKSPRKTKSRSSSPATPVSKANARAAKDYEAAYGALCSTYGFGGAPFAPTPSK